MLRQVAATLTGTARASDMPARLGGDEFAVLLAGPTPDADAAARRICTAVSAAMMRDGWPVTASIGAISFWDAPTDVEEALARADKLMYDAKTSGKNRIAHQDFGARTDRQHRVA